MTPQEIKDALIQNANDALALAQQIDVAQQTTGGTGATGSTGATSATGATAPSGNPYISRAKPGVLQSVDAGGTMNWGVKRYSADNPDGTTIFEANAVSQTDLSGLYLTQQGNDVFAKQLDGTWLRGTRSGPKKATVTVVDPLA